MTSEANGDFSMKLRLLWSSNVLVVKELVDVLRIQPTKTWIEGDPVHPLAKNVRKENCVLIEVCGNSLSETASRLIDSLGLSTDHLKVAHANIDVELSCIVTIKSHAPELHLTPEQVKFFSSINAALDIDIYVDECG